MKRLTLLLALLIGASSLTVAMERGTPTPQPSGTSQAPQPSGISEAPQPSATSEAPTITPAQEGPSLLEVIRKYFNLKGFLARLAVIFADERDDAQPAEGEQDDAQSDILTKEIIIAFIDALKIGNLPISIGQRTEEKPAEGTEGVKPPSKKVDDYFIPKKLKDLLKKIINDFFDTELVAEKTRLKAEIEQLTIAVADAKKNADEETVITRKETANRVHQQYERALQRAQEKLLEMGTYTLVKMFKECLKMDALKADLKNVEFLEIEGTFDAVLNYYKGNPSIDDCIYLDKLPALFGYRLETFCQVDDLKIAINKLLKRQPINAATIIDCFRFQPMLRFLSVKEDRIEEANLALHGLACWSIDFIRNREHAIDRLLHHMARMALEEKQLRDVESKPTEKK